MEQTVNEGQNIFDLTIKAYGSIEGLFLLLEENNLNSVNVFLSSGQKITSSQSPVDVDVFNFIQSRGLSFNTLEPENGGYFDTGYYENDGYYINA